MCALMKARSCLNEHKFKPGCLCLCMFCLYVDGVQIQITSWAERRDQFPLERPGGSFSANSVVSIQRVCSLVKFFISFSIFFFILFSLTLCCKIF